MVLYFCTIFRMPTKRRDTAVDNVNRANLNVSDAAFYGHLDDADTSPCNVITPWDDM